MHCFLYSIRHNAAEANLDKNHLDFTDEESAYTQFKSVANFTPHPGKQFLYFMCVGLNWSFELTFCTAVFVSYY